MAIADEMQRSVNDEIPKSRITLTYRIPDAVEEQEVDLPFRLLILGDLSKGTSKDCKGADGKPKTLDKREIHRLDGKNLNKVIKEMGITVNIPQVANKIDPATAESFPVALKIEEMSSFSPAEVAKQVPKIRALLLLKKLLLEVNEKISNEREFRDLLRALAKDPQKAKDLMEKDLKEYGSFKLPTKAEAPKAEAPKTETPKP